MTDDGQLELGGLAAGPSAEGPEASPDLPTAEDAPAEVVIPADASSEPSADQQKASSAAGTAPSVTVERPAGPRLFFLTNRMNLKAY